MLSRFSLILVALLCNGALARSAPQAIVSPPTPAQIAAQVVPIVQAQGPQPCTAIAPPDTLMGGLGSASPCTPRADATRPTVVQAANTVTDASGAWSVTWAKPFVSAAPVVVPVPVGVTALPMTCAVFSRSASDAAGRCWQAVTTTLGGTLATIAGAVISPFGVVGANTPVMVVAREPSQ